jgi:peptidyl-prolyl cis-trans isomerase B (cyclophilin B)
MISPLRVLLGCVLFAGIVFGCGESGQESPPAAQAEESMKDQDVKDEIAVIKVTGHGEMRIRFFPDKAPGHVENFKKLARDGFYDGTTFHRVIPGFMIQGGDPNSKDGNPENDGTGGPGYRIKAEFNDVPHKRGIVSMARARDPDSAGSQFFIVVKESSFLDGQYTVFGEVTSGMEVADKIVEQPRDPRDRPTTNVVMESVTLVAAD